MRFRIGGTFAACTGCGREDFFPALAITSGRRDVFICAHCGNEAFYSELIRRAGKEAGRASGEEPAP
jgi:hypothetical protein